METLKRIAAILHDLVPIHPNHRHFGTRSVYRGEWRRLFRMHIITGAMGMIALKIFTPSHVYCEYFFSKLNLPAGSLYIFHAVAAFTVIIQLVAPWLEYKAGNRKYCWYIFATITRFLFVVLLVLDLPQITYWLLILLFALRGLTTHLATPLWMSWVNDLIPPRTMGKFWGNRKKYIMIIQMVVLAGFGWLVTIVPPEHKLTAVKGVFAFGILVGVLDINLHNRFIPEPPAKKKPNTSGLGTFLVPLKDKVFCM